MIAWLARIIAWLARWRQRRDDARWARITAHAAEITARLGEDMARRRALLERERAPVLAQVGPHPLSGEAVGGSGAPDARGDPAALSPVLARADGDFEAWNREAAARAMREAGNDLRDQRSVW